MLDSVVPCVFGDLKGLDQISHDWLVRSGQDQTRSNQIRQEQTGSELVRSEQDQTCLKNLDLHKKLNGIIGRLVADYRAIFAIEVEFSRSFEKWVGSKAFSSCFKKKFLNDIWHLYYCIKKFTFLYTLRIVKEFLE